MSLLTGSVISLLGRLMFAMARTRVMLYISLVGLIPLGMALGIPVMTIAGTLGTLCAARGRHSRMRLPSPRVTVKRYTNDRTRTFGFSLYYSVMNVAALFAGPVTDLCGRCGRCGRCRCRSVLWLTPARQVPSRLRGWCGHHGGAILADSPRAAHWSGVNGAARRCCRRRPRVHVCSRLLQALITIVATFAFREVTITRDGALTVRSPSACAMSPAAAHTWLRSAVRAPARVAVGTRAAVCDAAALPAPHAVHGAGHHCAPGVQAHGQHLPQGAARAPPSAAVRCRAHAVRSTLCANWGRTRPTGASTASTPSWSLSWVRTLPPASAYRLCLPGCPLTTSAPASPPPLPPQCPSWVPTRAASTCTP